MDNNNTINYIHNECNQVGRQLDNIILATPTGEKRNKLTEANLLLFALIATLEEASKL